MSASNRALLSRHTQPAIKRGHDGLKAVQPHSTEEVVRHAQLLSVLRQWKRSGWEKEIVLNAVIAVVHSNEKRECGLLVLELPHFPSTSPDVTVRNGARHFRALQALEHDRRQAAIVLKLIGTIVNLYSSSFADEFVVGAFVGVLKAPPTARIEDEDTIKTWLPALDVINELLETLRASNGETAASGIGIVANDFYASARCIGSDGGGLNFNRVLLGIGRHPYILCSA